MRDTGKENFAAMNQAYAAFFRAHGVDVDGSGSGPNPPARMSVSGVSLALGAAVEIEVIAQMPA